MVTDLAICRAAPSLAFEFAVPLAAGEDWRARPVAVAVDSQGEELCVAEATRMGVHLLTGEGVEVFRTSRIAGVTDPADAMVDVDGRIVYVERSGARAASIGRLNVFGEPESYTPQPPATDWNPQHLVITRDGDYVTLDPGRGLLARHDATSGALRWQRMCRAGESTGEQMGRPAEAPDGSIYVPGGDLRHVLVFSPDGEPVAEFGRFGSAPGRFVLPVGVAFGPDGEILVLDRIRHKVLVFDQAHEFVTESGSMGLRPGQLYHPVAIAATAAGRVYIAQGHDGRIQAFRFAETDGGDADGAVRP